MEGKTQRRKDVKTKEKNTERKEMIQRYKEV